MLGHFSELSEELDLMEQDSLRRRLRTVTQTEKGKLTLDDKTLLNFSSNNYLGLARHPQVLEAVKQVLEHWGVGATSSRLISGSSIIHGDLESALAAFLNKEAALLFPTGYMANLGVISALVGSGDAIVMDRLCHASLVDAARLSGARLLVYAHADPEAAEQALKRAASFRRRLLVTESLFSMDGDFAPLSDLSALSKRYGAMSLVDEAHAIGVWGDGGRGCVAGVPSPLAGEGGRRPDEGSLAEWDVIIGTLSKSLGSQGGFVAGSSELMDVLINKARSFIFTTGLSPICVAAAHAALSLIQEDAKLSQHVQKISLQLRNGLRTLGFNTLNSQSQIVPILLGEAPSALRLAQHLQDAGVFAPAIRPPTVHAGECRIRFSMTAEHQEEDIEKVLEILRRFSSARERDHEA